MGEDHNNEDKSETVRLFVALPVATMLEQQVGALPQGGFKAQWNHGKDLHITLRFLGDLTPDRLPDIQDALEKVRRAPFHIEIAGLGLFENKRQSVLYAAIPSTRKLTALVTDITDRLAPLGFDFGTRPYVPHITLARSKQNQALKSYIKQYDRAIKARWQADDFVLMQSAPPDAQGQRYKYIKFYRLF